MFDAILIRRKLPLTKFLPKSHAIVVGIRQVVVYAIQKQWVLTRWFEYAGILNLSQKIICKKIITIKNLLNISIKEYFFSFKYILKYLVLQNHKNLKTHEK